MWTRNEKRPFWEGLCSPDQSITWYSPLREEMAQLGNVYQRSLKCSWPLTHQFHGILGRQPEIYVCNNFHAKTFSSVIYNDKNLEWTIISMVR